MTKPLPLRALLVSLREAALQGMSLPGGTYERRESLAVPEERVAEYHEHAERDGVNVGRWAAEAHLEGRYMDYCASAQGWAERQAMAPDEAIPVQRLGAFSELWQDALEGRRGRVIRIEAARSGQAFPSVGALAVYHRGGGRGHVERVTEAGVDGYWSLGANESDRPGRWVYEWRSYGHLQLVGFCEADERTTEDLVWFGEQWGRIPMYRGIDVSRYQWDVRWPLVAEDQHFAILRGLAGIDSSGAPVTDRRLPAHYSGASSTSLRVGLYHWVEQPTPGQPPVDLGRQLEAALRLSQQYPGEVLPAIDVEAHAGRQLDVEWWRQALPEILDAFANRWGALPILYVNPSDAGKLGRGPWSDCPLWLAQYTLRPEPRQPDGLADWSIWQWRANAFPKHKIPAGRHPGVEGGRVAVDLNQARSIPLAH